MVEIYKYNKNDFNENGLNNNGEFFLDVIHKWEVEFRNKYYFFANYFYANSSTMRLIKRGIKNLNTNDFGINGAVDFKTNLEKETRMKSQPIFVLNSEFKGDIHKPLFFVNDEDVSDGTVILKYILDDKDIKQESYTFNKYEYDENGYNILNDNLIIDFINNCEEDFHKRFPPLFAHNIIVNSTTMKMIETCHLIAQNEGIVRYGEMLFYKVSIYAIKESQFEENLHDIIIYSIDNEIRDGVIILNHLPEGNAKNIEL